VLLKYREDIIALTGPNLEAIEGSVDGIDENHTIADLLNQSLAIAG